MEDIVPMPGYYILQPLDIKPLETFGKTNIINPNAANNPEKFEQIEERYDQHPWQSIVRYVGPNTDQVKMICKPGDLVYTKTDISKRNVVMIGKQPHIYCPQGDIICIVNKKQDI